MLILVVLLGVLRGVLCDLRGGMRGWCLVRGGTRVLCADVVWFVLGWLGRLGERESLLVGIGFMLLGV